MVALKSRRISDDIIAMSKDKLTRSKRWIEFWQNEYEKRPSHPHQPIYPAISGRGVYAPKFRAFYLIWSRTLSLIPSPFFRAIEKPLPRRHSPRSQEMTTPGYLSLTPPMPGSHKLSAGNLDIVYVYASRWNVQSQILRTLLAASHRTMRHQEDDFLFPSI
ncbi:hypothetical protein DMENIID0001_065550 [Sergentomyia squamirostris]